MSVSCQKLTGPNNLSTIHRQRLSASRRAHWRARTRRRRTFPASFAIRARPLPVLADQSAHRQVTRGRRRPVRRLASPGGCPQAVGHESHGHGFISQQVNLEDLPTESSNNLSFAAACICASERLPTEDSADRRSLRTPSMRTTDRQRRVPASNPAAARKLGRVSRNPPAAGGGRTNSLGN